MVLRFKTGIFQKTVDTSTPTSQTIDVGFSPRGIILYTVGPTTAGTAFAEGYQVGMGFSDGINHRAVSTASEDNVTVSTITPTKTSRLMSDSDALTLINSSGQVIFRCSITAFGSSSFTVNTINNSTTADDIGYIAIGGDDITGLKVGSFTSSGTLGNQPITIPDPTFQPDIVFLLGTNQNTSQLNTGVTGGSITFSASTTSSQQAVVVNASRNGITTNGSDTARYQRTDKCYTAIWQADTTTIISEAAYVGPTSTGFTVNWTTAQANIPVFYLAIKGGSWKVGNFNQGTTVTTQDITNVNFQPEGVIVFGNGSPTQTVVQTQARMIFGATSITPATEQNVITLAERDASSTTLGVKGLSNTKLIRGITSEQQTAANTAVMPESNFVGMISNGFTINNTLVDPTTRLFMYVAAKSSVATTPVTGVTCKFRYNIQNPIAAPTMRFKYNLGGRVFPNALITHKYNILGLVLPSLKLRYDIRNSVTSTRKFKYNLNAPSTAITVSCKFVYDIVSQVSSKMRFVYDMDEADIYKTGYGKPYRCQIFITKPGVGSNIGQTLLIYNSFHPDDNNIKVNEFNVRLASDSAGDFSMTIEDHAKLIDPSVITAGCHVYARAAKTEAGLTDGRHTLFRGVVKSRQVIRQDTGTLEYRLEGYGLQVRTNERISNFVYAAKKKSFDNPEPDPTDTNMFAYNLVKKLIRGTDHLPLGEPALDLNIQTILDSEIRVTDFIPSINEYLTEFSSVMNTLADTTGAVWGVNPLGHLYFHYQTLEHSGITIKDRTDQIMDPETGRVIMLDDPTKTSYLIGPWSYTDDISKESGFSNRFFAKVGRKEQKGNNVINLTNVRDQYTPLFADEGTTEQPERNPLGPGGPDITSNPSTASAGVFVKGFEGYSVPGAQPGTPEYNEGFNILANVQRQYPTVKIVAELHVFSDASRPSQQTISESIRIEWENGIRTMQNGGVTCVARINGNADVLTEAELKQDIDTVLNFLPLLDGVSILNGHNVDEIKYKQFYINIGNYIRSVKGKKFAVLYAATGFVHQSWLTDMQFDLFEIGNNASLLPYGDREMSWYSQTPVRRRAENAYNINANTGYTEDNVRQWINEHVEHHVAGYFGVVSENNSFSFGAVPSWINTVASELQRIQQSGTDITIVQQPSFRDIAQSFIPTTSDLSDVMLLLSKVGNPKWNAGGSTTQNKLTDYDYPNYIHGHIEGSKTLSYEELDPSSGEMVTKTTEMPSGEFVAVFGFPFDDIGSNPTTVFLNNVQIQKGTSGIIPGRRYWVVLFGRGQDENNTIRWHHSDATIAESLSAERSPGGHNVTQNWTVYNKSQSPGFALSYFDKTLDFLEASDSDSMEQFELVESVLDLSFIEDEIIAAKFLQTIVNQAAKPKRLYDMNKITAPDELLLPGQLVSIVDEMSGHGTSGSDQIDAEIIEVEYNFNAYEHPLGAMFISVRPIGYVDFAYQLWKKKLERGEIAIPAGEDIVITPAPEPEPETPPVEEPPLPPPTCPTGQHWDAALQQCVSDTPPPPPPAPPPDLDRTGIKRTRGPYTVYQDFLSAVNSAIAGDEIILGNGSYSIPSSADTSFSDRAGTITNPIIVRAENVGGVTLTGSAGYHFTNCDNFTWYGFIHKHTDSGGTGGSISVEGGSNNFRFARCEVALQNNATGRVHWFHLEDSTTFRMDHCYFHNKTTEASFLNTSFSSNNTQPQGWLIEYCRFSHQNWSVHDSGEACQIGSSPECRTYQRGTMRYCYFDNNDGDGEIITNKSSGNTYYHNTFISNQGSLTLRHGDTNTVIGNYFEGNNGLRIGGADNKIANNHFTLNSTTNESNQSARRPIVLMNGDAERPTSQGAHYERVVNNTIVFNTIQNGAGTGTQLVRWGWRAESLKPTGNTFRGNIIKGQNGVILEFSDGATASGNTITDNIGHATSNASYSDFSTAMGDRADPGLTRDPDGVYRITAVGSLAHHYLSNTTNVFSSTTTEDFDGQTRTNRSDAGSDHFSTATKPHKRITVDDVGPSASTVLS
jgi:hypothetical protein